MRIIKFGHACILVVVKGLKVLVDPGAYTQVPEVAELDVILLTHEHQDHVLLSSVTTLIAAHPQVEIITHIGLNEVLKDVSCKVTYVTHEERVTRKGIVIQSLGEAHACIHPELPQVQNTGFMIDEYLYYPGDSFFVPEQKVSVLALPVAAPWLRLEEAITYARAVGAKTVFPVHDGMLKDECLGPTRRIPTMLLEKDGITFVDMMPNMSRDF